MCLNTKKRKKQLLLCRYKLAHGFCKHNSLPLKKSFIKFLLPIYQFLFFKYTRNMINSCKISFFFPWIFNTSNISFFVYVLKLHSNRDFYSTFLEKLFPSFPLCINCFYILGSFYSTRLRMWPQLLFPCLSRMWKFIFKFEVFL